MVCGLEDLPEAVGRVTQLRTLSLYNSLPEAVWRLDQLVTLNLVANRLESVPEGIGWLTRLQMLDLGMTNWLPARPYFSLDLRWNRFSSPHAEVGAAQCTRMYSVCITDRSVEEIHAGLRRSLEAPVARVGQAHDARVDRYRY